MLPRKSMVVCDNSAGVDGPRLRESGSVTHPVTMVSEFAHAMSAHLPDQAPSWTGMTRGAQESAPGHARCPAGLDEEIHPREKV